MSSPNQWGHRLVAMTYGESHGPAMGVVIDGCPAGLHFDEGLIRGRLARRRPGHNPWASGRREIDEPEVLSGVYEGKTLGTPIAIMVRNQDAKSKDYAGMKPRSGHADQVWSDKFGHRDPRGGGRSSGRETLCRVIVGAVAEMICKRVFPELRVVGYVRQLGPVALTHEEWVGVRAQLRANTLDIDEFPGRLPHATKSATLEVLLSEAKTQGHSYGGNIELLVLHPPKNLGQPVFHKIKADLATAFFSLGATCSLDVGEAEAALFSEGSIFHDQHSPYGGIQGGITTGEEIRWNVGFKPPSSVLDVAKNGRHDPSIAPRAVPVLEAMCWWVLADHWLWSITDRIDRLERE